MPTPYLFNDIYWSVHWNEDKQHSDVITDDNKYKRVFQDDDDEDDDTSVSFQDVK